MKLRTDINELAVSTRAGREIRHDAILAHCMQQAMAEARQIKIISDTFSIACDWIEQRTAELARGYGLIED